MKKVSIISDVHNGSFRRNKPLISKALEAFEGKTVELTINRATKRRSNAQNAYYWAVVIPLMQKAIWDTWGEVRSKEYIHEFLKANCGYKELVNRQTGEIIRVPKSTTENTTTEQEEYHESCRQLAHEFFGVEIPLPNEELTLEI